MNIQKEYERLYTHWLDEFQQIELTPLSKELINYYNNILSQLKYAQKGQKKIIQDQIVDSYLENYKFLINDFLKLREIKIINAALALQEIDFNHTLEVEKLFYQKLVSSLNGFKKMRIFTIFDDTGAELDDTSTELETNEMIKLEQILPIIKEDISEKEQSEVPPKQQNVPYALIRFISKAPPLVGVDFLNYGPFEKEDVACIPLKNAKILIHEKFAEPINIS